MISNLLAAARTPRVVHVSRGPVVEPWITQIAIATVVVSVFGALVWLGSALVTERSESWRREQRVCDVAAKALVRQKPMLANTVELVDRCHYLRRLQGNEP